MLKKILSILLVLLLILAFAGCKKDPATDPTSETLEEDPGVIDEETTPETINADYAEQTTCIVLPAALFAEEDMTAFDGYTFAIENGFVSAELCENGDVSVTISEQHQSDLQDQLIAEIANAINTYTTNEATSFIKEITYEDHYTSFTVNVIREEYDSLIDIVVKTLGKSAISYQLYSGKTPGVIFSVVDSASGDVIDTFQHTLP